MQNRFKFLTKNKFILYLFLLSIFIKIALAYLIPIVGDESYYWVWGQNLQLSYFDHPPAVAWITWISNLIYNYLPLSYFWLSLRLPFIILSSITFIVWLKNYSLEKNEKNTGAVYFSVLYFLNPLLGPGGLFATPDVPLLLFWSLSYFAVLKIKETQQLKWYSFLGIFLGLGFCSKYHIILFPVSLFLSLAILKDLKIVQPKKLILTILFGFIFSLPVLIWNYQNQWSSFLFQLNHGLQSKKIFSISWPITYLLGQILLFNPVLIYWIIKNIRRSSSKNVAFLQWGFFLYSSFKALVEANWPLTSHSQGMLTINKNFKSYFRFSLLYWGLIWVSIIVFFQLSFGKSKLNYLPQSIAASEILNEVTGLSPLYGPTYQMSSLLHLLSGKKIFKLYNLSRIDFYDSLPESHPSEKIFYQLKYTETTWPDYLKFCKTENIKSIQKYNLEIFKVTCE